MSLLLKLLKKRLPETTGMIDEVSIPNMDMEGFTQCEASSLKEEERDLPNGTWITQMTELKTKFFFKKENHWYSCTTTLEYPNGVPKTEFQEA